MSEILSVSELKKVYGKGGAVTHALDGVSLSLEAGEFVGVMGPSGSGKTTLLNCVSTIDRPTSGSIVIDGKELTRLRGTELARFRRENLGFVFQDFNLLDTLSVRDNIFLPLVLGRYKYGEMAKRLKALAPKLNIEDLLNKQPFELSGGQKQRVAVARALITNPKLILADEPTAALDSKNSDGLLELFEQINNEGQTILMVTHSSLAASHASRVLFIKDGQIFHQLYRAGKSNNEFNRDITTAITSLLGGE